MNLFSFISKYFWVIGAFVMLFNLRASPQLREDLMRDPVFAWEHRRLKQRYTLLLLLPWIIMGLGIMSGGVHSVWSYLRPQDLDAWVLGLHAYNLLLAAACLVWAVWFRGARTIAKHHLFEAYFFGKPVTITEQRARLFALLMFVGYIVSIVSLALSDVKIPG